MDLERNDLEMRLHGIGTNNFKSRGESKIAKFLADNNIRYHYEQGVLIEPGDQKSRIWYPDFYLPEFGMYIEYYGIVGDPDYDKGIKAKESAYSRMGLDVIPVYPDMFEKNWKKYLIDKIGDRIQKQYEKLSSMPFQGSLFRRQYNFWE
jgi:hypothetical protein